MIKPKFMDYLKFVYNLYIIQIYLKFVHVIYYLRNHHLMINLICIDTLLFYFNIFLAANNLKFFNLHTVYILTLQTLTHIILITQQWCIKTEAKLNFKRRMRARARHREWKNVVVYLN